jgi:L-amino acid N-acyltransferase YncA
MAEIKPAEISAILKQVEGFESGATLEEVGTYFKLEMVLLVFTGFLIFNMES